MPDLNEYEKLCEEVWRHNRLYFTESKPVISDFEYDKMYARLVELEKDHPEWISPGSPTQRVGEVLTSGFQTVEHRIPMLSLDNTYNQEELADFIARVHKLSGQANVNFYVELKMDGIAISAYYEKGIFTRAVTRGDGKRGDNITSNMRTIEALPLRLYGAQVPDLLEVRGEVFMPREVFKKLNKQKENESEELYANPRNAAAGSLKLLDPKEVKKRQLSVVFYGIADSMGIVSTQCATHQYLKDLGLPTLSLRESCKSLDEIVKFADKILQERFKLPFDIDGIVVKIDDLSLQKKLGTTARSPRWAVAYKFAPEQAITKILDITVQVGRTGTLTPVAELEPVLLAGSTISRATLHNEEEVQRKDIRIGDVATIEKGGDVIPKVVKVDLNVRSKESKPWKMPTHCPSCDTPISRIEGEVAVRCPNRQCPEQQLGRIVYFVGKEAMDIEHLGRKVTEQLLKRGFIAKPSDIYKLERSQLEQLDGFKDKSIENLLKSIDKSRHVSLSRFIMALGIKHVGSGTAELLAAKAGDLQSLMNINKPSLLRIEGIGEKVADAILEYFHDESNREEIQRLLQFGVLPKQQEVKMYSGHTFEDKSFVITGTLNGYTRDSAAKLIKERGGKIASSVTKKTHYLLLGADPGSKLADAKKHGVTILDEETFISLL